MKRFNVVIPMAEGGVEIHPMKDWLRQHPEVLGIDPSLYNSHQLRSALRKEGWGVQEIPNEVRLMPPASDDSEELIKTVLGEEDESEDENDIAAFGMESQLRDFLAQNITTIPVNGKRLRLYIDPTGRDGIEYPTAVGRIDILTVDDEENFVVFELKRARSPDHAIGQLSRYMGWIMDTIGKGKKVCGVIVAKSISANLRYSIKAVPNVTLFEYEVKFELKPVA